MKLKRAISLRRHLTYFFLTISIISAFLFGELLIRYFEYGIEDSVKMRMLTEWRAYSEAYEKDNTLPLPSSYVVSFHYDNLPPMIINDLNVFEGLEMENEEFKVIDVDEELDNNIEDHITVGIYKFEKPNGRAVYAVVKYDYRLISDTIDVWFDSRFNIILLIASAYVFIILAALSFFSYKIGKRTEQLVDWAGKVSNDLTSNPVPNFKFDEYNRVALFLEKALRRNARLAEREKRFLSHASHELRTPIAIVRANMEILERVDLPSNSMRSIQRIDRASKNMQQIVETMLWLARKSNMAPAVKEVSIPSMLDNVIESSMYLINAEDVSITQDYTHAPTIPLPKGPFEIVIGNLVRNAFQYTYIGQISIRYEDNCIVVENYNSQEIGSQFDDGFGLGQDLNGKICTKLGWQLETDESHGRFIAKLQLPLVDVQ